MSARLGALLLVGAAPLAGCTGTNAALLTVTAGPPGIVRRLEVHIASHDGKNLDDFVVPDSEGEPLTFPRTIAITFPSTVKGYIDVRVEGKSGGATVAVGEGFSSTPVVSGGVTRIDLAIEATGAMVGGDMATAAMDMAARD